MNLRFAKTSILIAVGLCIFGAQGIIIRHDKSPAGYEVRPSRYPAVFFIEKQGSSKVCVATVIHRQWAITAAHCAAETSLANTIENGLRFGVQVANRQREIDRLIIHPVHDLQSGSDVDLALIRFREASPIPQPLPLRTAPAQAGDTLTILGWGYFGLGTTGRQYDDGRLRLAQNRISAVAGRLRIRFDDPRDRNGESLELEGMPGLGDSGGPAFIQSDNGPVLAGVAVGEIVGADFSEDTQGRYGSVAIYERISQHIDWIETIIGSRLPFDS